MSFTKKLIRVDHGGRDHDGKVLAVRVFGVSCLVIQDYREEHGELAVNFMHWRVWRSVGKNDRLLRVPEGSVLYFDHSYGGGTDSYFNYTLSTWQGGKSLVRVQYIVRVGVFRVSVYRPDATTPEQFHFPSMQSLQESLISTKWDALIVSNLVGYKVSGILATIERIIRHSRPGKVSFLCHDYFAVCPSFNLMNGNRYCRAETDMAKCQSCIRERLKRTWILDRDTVMPGPKDISSWRRMWGNFLQHTATEIIAFDDSVADIFCKYYPSIRNKIRIVPHRIPSLRKVSTPTDKRKMTVAVIGNIHQVKGSEVLAALDSVMEDYPDMEIVVLGETGVAFNNITKCGKYKVEDLPDLLEEAGASAVFIPSIWPETFSYTTSEALAMGLPTICFDLGAPANRVSQTPNGLVLPLALAEQPRELMAEMRRHLQSLDRASQS